MINIEIKKTITGDGMYYYGVYVNETLFDTTSSWSDANACVNLIISGRVNINKPFKTL